MSRTFLTLFQVEQVMIYTLFNALILLSEASTMYSAEAPPKVSVYDKLAKAVVQTQTYEEYTEAINLAKAGKLKVANTKATQGTIIDEFFDGELVLPDAKNGQSWICLMTLVSDDGCDVTIDGESWLNDFGKGHDISKGARTWPGVFASGRLYTLRIHYSQVWYKPGIDDKDGISVILCLLPVSINVDANGDGTIDKGELASEKDPFDMWLNDDDDIAEPNPPKRPDYSTPHVDGKKDLYDFFPVFLDIQPLVLAMPPSLSVKYKLKQSDSALNFVETSLTQAEAFAFRKSDRYANKKTVEITDVGVELSSEFLNNIQSNNQGVILVEGTTPSKAPLVLTVEKNGQVIATISLPLKLGARIVLLMHGMNSNTSAWDVFVERYFGNPINTGAGTILDGQIIEAKSPVMTNNGVRCYRLQFGTYDSFSTRKGLQDFFTAANTTDFVTAKNTLNYLRDKKTLRCGDFETFDELGQEVDDAIEELLRPEKHPENKYAKIILVGHSRGGIAGRAFLQSALPSRTSVIGFLTTGTPHLGSRMGRIYNWLDTHKRGRKVRIRMTGKLLTY